LKLAWEIGDADRRGVGYWSLPVTRSHARDLLRGRYQGPPLRAVRNTRGQLADVIALGWVGIVGVSPRFVEAAAELDGLTFVPLELVDGPEGYAVLGSHVQCPSINYAALVEVERMGAFRQP
jgi:hypothetical protein